MAALVSPAVMPGAAPAAAPPAPPAASPPAASPPPAPPAGVTEDSERAKAAATWLASRSPAGASAESPVVIPSVALPGSGASYLEKPTTTTGLIGTVRARTPFTTEADKAAYYESLSGMAENDASAHVNAQANQYEQYKGYRAQMLAHQADATQAITALPVDNPFDEPPPSAERLFLAKIPVADRAQARKDFAKATEGMDESERMDHYFAFKGMSGPDLKKAVGEQVTTMTIADHAREREAASSPQGQYDAIAKSALGKPGAERYAEIMGGTNEEAKAKTRTAYKGFNPDDPKSVAAVAESMGMEPPAKVRKDVDGEPGWFSKTAEGAGKFSAIMGAPGSVATTFNSGLGAVDSLTGRKEKKAAQTAAAVADAKTLADSGTKRREAHDKRIEEGRKTFAETIKAGQEGRDKRAQLEEQRAARVAQAREARRIAPDSAAAALRDANRVGTGKEGAPSRSGALGEYHAQLSGISGGRQAEDPAARKLRLENERQREQKTRDRA